MVSVINTTAFTTSTTSTTSTNSTNSTTPTTPTTSTTTTSITTQTTTQTINPAITPATTTASQSTCVPTTSGPAPSACVTSLPPACANLASVQGLSLVTSVVGCTAVLGPFAIGNTAKCLSTTLISANTQGQTIVDCLLNSFKGNCITLLPKPCTDLATVKGLALVPNLLLCVTALGPYAVGSALTCLAIFGITTTSNGVGIIQCLETSLGLVAPTSGVGGNSGGCPTTPPPTCAVQLPPNCSQLSQSTGLALLLSAPLCLVALGLYGVGNIAQCLVTTNINVGTLGTDLVGCLTNALSQQCIKKPPDACNNLKSDGLLELVVDIPLCVIALGPFAAGKALTCLSTSQGSGTDIVNCLDSALGIIL